MTPVSAHSPVRSGPTSIDMMVKFAEFPNEIPFTASLNDSTDYGPKLYQQALNGEFGAIS